MLSYHGSRAELLARLRQLPAFLAGNLPDRDGLVSQLNQVLGVELLGKIKDDYVLKSEGGSGKVGGRWAPLSPVTLSLRRKGSSGPAAVTKLRADFGKLPKHRQALVAVQFQRLQELYTAGGRASTGARARRHARRLLELMRPYIAAGRYKKLAGELAKPLPTKRAERLAAIGAYALILRDTGRLLNSLSPGIKSADQVNETQPGGKIIVGSNVDYLKDHQSDRPRKLKKDGTPKLPRRQVLPDDGQPIPSDWWQAMLTSYGKGIASEAFLSRYLAA